MGFNTNTNTGEVILKSCKVETGILLVLRLLSRGRINIGPHFSGKTKLLIVSLNRRAGWVSPFSATVRNPRPSVGDGDNRAHATDMTRALFSRLFGKGVAAFRTSMWRFIGWKESSLIPQYLHWSAGPRPFVQSDVHRQNWVWSFQTGLAGRWWSVIGIEPAAFLVL